MNRLQSKLNTACLVIIAISLAIIAFRQLHPDIVTTDMGQVMDPGSGKIFYRAGSRFTPAHESMEEELRREYPGGKIYK